MVSIIHVQHPYCHREDISDSVDDLRFCLKKRGANIRSCLLTVCFRCNVSCSVQGEASYCDIVVWTENDVHIERIHPDEDFWLANVAKAKYFLSLPEHFGKFYSHTTYNHPHS